MKWQTFATVLCSLAAMLCGAAQEDDWLQGQLALDIGRPDIAVDAFRRALASAPKGRGKLGLKLALSTAYLEDGDLHSAEQTLNEIQQTDAGSMSALNVAELACDRGSLWLRQGRWRDARNEFLRSLQLLEENRDGTRLLPTVLNNLAAVEIKMGDYQAAFTHQNDALARWASFLGPDDHHIIKGEGSLATLQFLSGHPEQAHVTMDRAISSARRTLGPESPLLAELLYTDSIILRNLKRRKEAKLAEKEAARISPHKHAHGTPAYVLDSKTAASQAPNVALVLH